MTTQMRVKIEGVSEVIAQIKRRGGNVQDGLEAIMNAAAEPIQDAATANARSISQRTADAMTKETVLKRGGRVEVHIGPEKSRAFYAHIIEFGARPHRIVPRRAKALRFINGLIRRSANHPGSPARPFMRPAFDNRHDEATAIAAAEIKKRLR
jgi:HK97 gp10 family phage protein